ncbi:LysM peptidoglycan-binding domain-containing protein [Balneolales bacterium ANBcel1]|nr:LysM peptidoglycan-binding domain-containing protein [Balneolales bacterium ANBcel1]
MIPSIAAAQPDRETHTVRAGETLFGISRQYDIPVDQLREWNQMPDNQLRIGQQLYLSPGHPDSRESRRTTVEPDTTVHAVEAGQTLFRISRIYDVPVDDILAWNEMDSPALSIGQELVIVRHRQVAEPTPDAATPVADDSPRRDTVPVTDTAPEDIPPDVTAETEPDQPAYYEVRPGDSLYRIASRFGMSVDELMELNRLEDSRIHVGQELRVRTRPTPPPSVTAEWERESTPQGKFIRYTVGDQDSISQLLQFHGMDHYDFRALNPELGLDDVRPGDEITLLLAATTTRSNPYIIRQGSQETTRMQVSRYPDNRRGTTTTSGDLYNPEALTAAHPGLPLGSVIYIQNPGNNRGTFVLINDRTTDNRLMLSEAAFQSLAFTDAAQLFVTIQEQGVD